MVFAAAALVATAAPAADPSPKPAVPDFPEQASAQPQASKRILFPEVRAQHEMVGGGNNFVVNAGLRILHQGGNAVDAGVAAVLAAAVTEEDHFSLGGEMPALIKMKGRPVEVISGVGTAPKAATLAFFEHRPLEPWESPDRKPPIPAQGILAATTPGVFDGLMLALKTRGTMSFAQVAAPALELADGFPTTEIFADVLARDEALVRTWPSSLATFFSVDGRLPRRGEIYHQPDLAKTFRGMIAAEQVVKAKGRLAGIDATRDYFYRGPVAQEMGAYSQAHGGLVTAADIAAFRAETDTPRSTMFRGYEIVKPGFWTQGPVLLEMLNLLGAYDLKAMGHNSPRYLHVLIEAAKLAFADRDMFYGDPKFGRIPEATLLSMDYAGARRALIDEAHASPESRPGTIPGYGSALPSGRSAKVEVKDTTCVDVVDRDGNVFSATPSGAWFPAVMGGTSGIAYSTRLQSFVTTPGHPNILAEGKRPRVTLSPTLILKDGEPVIAISTPGADNQDQALLQVILNMLVFDMSPQEAAEAPRFQTEALYASFAMHDYSPGKVSLESRIPQATADALAALGHKVSVLGPWSNGSAPVAIRIGDGVLEGAADPRRNRFIDGD